MSPVSAMIEKFEAGTLPKADWKHAAHLTVALWYVTRHTPEEALTRMREGILFLNGCHGVKNTPTGGYHETLTVFWLAIVRQFARSADPALSIKDLAAALVEAYANQQALWREYYSFDVVNSQEARASWIEPDLRSIQ